MRLQSTAFGLETKKHMPNVTSPYTWFIQIKLVTQREICSLGRRAKLDARGERLWGSDWYGEDENGLEYQRERELSSKLLFMSLYK